MIETTLAKKHGWAGYGAIVALLHAAGFLCLFLAVRHHPAVLGMGVLAYSFGLRHAFDVDHIAAIDNTVRKLIQQEQNPLGVGFFFSLGHSTVVLCMAVATAFAVAWADREIPQLREIGGVIGTSISGVFLLLIGIVNLIILANIYQVFMKMRQGSYAATQMEKQLLARGFIARFIQPLFNLIHKSWHVYPLGFLFGLGFDTASEVALLAISAGAAKSAIPVTGILSLPLLFAAGMSLLDTADGVFMTTAYRWAFTTPLRKVYYNLTVTGLGVAAALLIGLVELAQVLTPQLGLTQGFWKWLQELDFGSLGYLLVILFVAAWVLSYGSWKLFRIEERWGKIS